MVNPEVTKYCLITCAADSRAEAQRLADLLVELRLAACVQLVDIASAFTWQGKVEHAQDGVLLIKTRTVLYPQVERLLRENHSYSVPEILQIPIENGLPDYLQWMHEVTSGNTKGADES